MKKKLIIALAVLFFVSTAHAAMTVSATDILRNARNVTIGNQYQNPLYRWANEAESAIEAFGLDSELTLTIPASGYMIFPEISAPSGNPASNLVWLYSKDNSGTSALYCELDDGTVQLVAPGSGDNTLDAAYDQGGVGSGRAIDVDSGAVTLTVSDTDNNVALVVAQDDSTNDPTAVQITSAADLANAIALDIDAQATGRDIEGTGASWYVSGAGLGTFTGATVAGATSINDSATTNATSIGGGTTTGAVSVATGASAQTVNVGTGAGAKTVALGSTNTTSTTSVNSGSGGVNINASNNQPANINTGTATGTVTVGGTGAMAINVGAGGTGAKTIAIGDGASTGTTTIQSGSSGLSINASTNAATNINTGSSTGTVTIGNASSAATVLSSGLTLGVDGTDVPLTWYAETAGAELTATGDLWTFDGIDLVINDGDFVLFGDSGDVSLSSTSNVFTIGQVVSGTGTIAIGANNKGLDTTFYAETDGDSLTWDQDGGSNLGALIFEDSVLQFAGANVTYSEAISTDALQITATDHGNASLEFGANNTNGLNVTFNGQASGDTVVLDAGAGTWTFTDIQQVVTGADESGTLLAVTGIDTTGNTDSVTIAHSGTGDGAQITCSTATSVALNLVAATSQTTALAKFDGSTGSWLGADGVGMLQVTNDGTLAHVNSALMNITNTGIPQNDARGSCVRIVDSGNAAAGTAGYSMYIQTTDATMEALYVDDGDVLIDDDLSVGGTVTFGGQTRMVRFDPKVVELDGSNPPTLTDHGTDAQCNISSLQFDADGGITGDDICYISWKVPDGYVTDSARLNVAYTFSTAEDAADEAQFDFAVNSVAAGEALDAAGTALADQATVISDASADNGNLHITQYNIEVEDIVIDDLVTIEIAVDESASALAASGTLDVLYLEIEYESTE